MQNLQMNKVCVSKHKFAKGKVLGIYRVDVQTVKLAGLWHDIGHGPSSRLFESLDMDVSTTMIVKPGPVIEVLLANQKVDHPERID